MKDYSFEQLWKDLNDGYQIYYTYMKKRYILTKLRSNCYSRELISMQEREVQPAKTIITLKSVKETFPFMEDIEYKVMISE